MMGQRKGFTLVELLMVVVILGLLATIMVVQTRRANETAYRTSMRTDLRNLAVQQELYHQINLQYAQLTDLEHYETSPGVTIEVTWIDPGGFAATALHAAAPSVQCGYFTGGAPTGSADPAEQEANIVCR